METRIRIVVLLSIVLPVSVSAEARDRIVIAHRGASGYLPEHTLAAKAMAYALGSDFIEQDLVMTRDDRLVVLHDLYLDRISDVQTVFPGRQRANGRFYAIDFTLKEIRMLAVSERYRIAGGKKVAVYPGRFPLGQSRFRVHTFEEEVELIQGLNHSTGKQVGLYPELKQSKFHRNEGKDLARAVLKVLKQYGYTAKRDKVFVQSFEFDEGRRLHDTVLPSMGMDLRIVFLVSGGKSFSWVSLPGGMETIAKHADGIGPSVSMLVDKASKPGDVRLTGLVRAAHRAGLVVHPYTFRLEQAALPSFAASPDQLLEILWNRAHIDGLFTDFPDRVDLFLKNSESKAPHGP